MRVALPFLPGVGVLTIDSASLHSFGVMQDL